MEQGKQQERNWNEQIYNMIRDAAARWHIICLAGLITAIVVDLFLTLTYTPIYQTETSVVLRSGGTVSQSGEDTDVAEALGYILSSNVFLNKVAADLGVSELDGTYITTAVPGTNIVKIAAQANSPQISYRMMYIMMERYQEVTSLVIGDTKIEIIDKMQVPLVPHNGVRHLRNLLLYGAIGAFVMLMIFVLFSYMRDTLKEKRDVKEKLQIRLLAGVASEPKLTIRGGRIRRKKAILITQLTTSFAFVETFKRLRTRFEAQAQKRDYKVIVVSSTMENEGKTSIVVNLGIALAQQGRKVLIMDADLGKPALGRILDSEPEHGLEEALRGEVTIDETLYHHGRTKLDCIFAKEAVGDSTELLENGILQKWLKNNRNRYDYILLDTPPASYMSASMITAQYADAVLLVARQDYAPVVLINRTIERYLAQDTPVMGCVLNRSMPFIGRQQRNYRYKGGGHSGTE